MPKLLSVWLHNGFILQVNLAITIELGGKKAIVVSNIVISKIHVKGWGIFFFQNKLYLMIKNTKYIKKNHGKTIYKNNLHIQ